MSPGQLGLVLLAISLGAVLALPLAGAVVHRLGPATSVRLMVLLGEVGLAIVGLARATAVLVVGLFVLGVASGIWDVAMNVEGAHVERRLGRPILPRFHGGWSLGTVIGAGLGAAAAAAGVPLREHLLAVMVVGLAAGLAAAAFFLPGEHVPGSAPDGAGPAAAVPVDSRGSGALAAWRERRTLTIGLMVLGMAFCEGSANDWLAVGVVDGYRVDNAVGAAGYGVFVTAMTAARLAGPAALTRWGRVPVLRGGALLVLVGIGLVVAGPGLAGPLGRAPALAAAALGAFAWGCGAALGFPVGMSAAADDPSRAPARVGVVATIGYTAFIAGPPLLGRLGDHVGVLRSLLAVSAAVAVAMVTAGAARGPDGESG